MGDNERLSNDNDILNDDKVEIKIPHSNTEEKTDDDGSSLSESNIENMLKDPSRIYNGRSNVLIFRSGDTDLKLFRKLCNVTTPIIAFILTSEENFEFLYL